MPTNGGSLIAIDPGSVSGALAIRHPGGEIVVGDVPVVDRQVDAAALARLIRDMKVGQAVIEFVSARPGQGVTSMFRFGYGCGAIFGAVASLGIPVRFVTPQTWKKHHKLSGTDKEASRARAIQLYPSVKGLELKKHQGRAEALLILDWYQNTQEK